MTRPPTADLGGSFLGNANLSESSYHICALPHIKAYTVCRHLSCAIFGKVSPTITGLISRIVVAAFEFPTIKERCFKAMIPEPRKPVGNCLLDSLPAADNERI